MCTRVFHLCLVCVLHSVSTLLLTPNGSWLVFPKSEDYENHDLFGFIFFNSKVYFSKKKTGNLKSKNWVYNLELLSSDASWKCLLKGFVLWLAALYTSGKTRTEVMLLWLEAWRLEPHKISAYTPTAPLSCAVMHMHTCTHARSRSCLVNYFLTEEPSWVMKSICCPLWSCLTSCAPGGRRAGM